MVSGSGRSPWIVDEGGQAGIVCSVGGSGGQMSVAAGMTSGGGAESLIETAGGCVAIPLSPRSGVDVSSRGAGTVWAQVGVGFCITTACLGSVPVSGSASGSLGRVSVCAHSGSLVFCIGSAGNGSASEAVLVADWRAPSSTAGATGTVRAHTGVVSCVGTAGTGSSGDVDCFGFSASVSTSIVSLALPNGVVSELQANTLVRASSATGSGCCSAQSAASDASLSQSACTLAAPSAVIQR